MDMAAWLIVAASLSFSATLAVYVTCMTVPRARHDAALRQLEKQRDMIDRLLARHFERAAGDNAEWFKAQFLDRHKPVERP
jgi:hypothetical protein